MNGIPKSYAIAVYPSTLELSSPLVLSYDDYGIEQDMGTNWTRWRNTLVLL